MARNPQRIGRLTRVRKVQEEQARAVWQQAVNAHREAEQAFDELQASMLEARSQLADPNGVHRPGWVAVNQQLEKHLAQRILIARRKTDQAKLQVDAAEEPWRERRSQAKGLERLLENVREAQIHEAEEVQNRELDEVALGRSQRPSRSE